MYQYAPFKGEVDAVWGHALCVDDVPHTVSYAILDKEGATVPLGGQRGTEQHFAAQVAGAAAALRRRPPPPKPLLRDHALQAPPDAER